MVLKIRVYNDKSLDSLGNHAIKKVSVLNAIRILFTKSQYSFIET